MTPISQNKAGQGSKKKSNSETSLTIVKIDPRNLKPSSKNEKVYKPIDPEDPAIKELARDIAENGVLDPLVVSADGYILSGHRRCEAAILAGLKVVPCRRVDIRHSDPEFLDLLVSHNTQRIKNRREQLLETIVKSDPDEAYRQLLAFREKQSEIKIETIDVGSRGRRKRISKLKSKMVKVVKDVINTNRKFWPLSDRQIHYRLLNNPPLRNTNRPGSVYRNDRASYGDLCNVLTRLRLTGEIPMTAIADPTRPTSSWYVHSSPQDFAREELDDFLKGYRRDLQQSQPIHIEVVAEKMTVQSIIEPVCGKFNIPYTICRGYPSLPARYEMVERFKRSGKERLLLLVLGDFDPEGINIGESLLQSLREDFGVKNAQAVRVGLNPEHVERFNLSDNTAEAKETSARYKGFVKRFGKKVYELESITPEQLQHILSEAIDSVIDVELFNTELKAERSDAAYLQVVRERIYDNALDLLKDCEAEQLDAGDDIEF